MPKGKKNVNVETLFIGIKVIFGEAFLGSTAFDTHRELDLIAFKVISSSYIQNQTASWGLLF